MRPPYVGKQPRYGPLRKRQFKRSPFLSGDQPTYFAPGQTPNVISSYVAPNDWRPHGGLLVPPQVVWLSVAPILGPYQEVFVNGTYLCWDVIQVNFSSDSAYGGNPPFSFSNISKTGTFTRSGYFSDGHILTDTFTWAYNNSDGKVHFTFTPAAESKYSYPVCSGALAISLSGTYPDTSYLSVLHSDWQDPPARPTSDPSDTTWLSNAQAAFNPGIATALGATTPVPNATLQSWAESFWDTTPWYNQTVPDILDEQYKRLIALFNQVQTKISQIRQGKTWVQVNDFSILNFPWYAIYPCVSFECAPPSPPKFFGVDFLHVHCLNIAAQGLPPDNNFGFDTDCLPASEAQLQAAFPQFLRYVCKIYQPDGVFQNFPPPSPIPNAYPSPPYPIGTTSLDSNGSYRTCAMWTDPNNNSDLLDQLTNTTGNSAVQTFSDNRIVTINSENSYLNSLIPGTNALLASEAAAMSAYGLQLSGVESDLDSVETIVKLIADFFNFDVDTGLNK